MISSFCLSQLFCIKYIFTHDLCLCLGVSTSWMSRVRHSHSLPARRRRSWRRWLRSGPWKVWGRSVWPTRTSPGTNLHPYGRKRTPWSRNWPASLWLALRIQSGMRYVNPAIIAPWSLSYADLIFCFNLWPNTTPNSTPIPKSKPSLEPRFQSLPYIWTKKAHFHRIQTR